MSAYRNQAHSVAETAHEYDERMCEATMESIYEYGKGVLGGEDLDIDDEWVVQGGTTCPELVHEQPVGASEET